MEYITRHCPSCQGELQVPADMKSCICMYCGVSFNLQEESKTEVSEESRRTVEEGYRKVLVDLPLLLNDYEILLMRFTRDKYAESFAEFEELGRKVLGPAERYAGLPNIDVGSVATELANVILDIFEKVIEEKSKKKKVPKGTIIDQLRFFQTVYLVPMIKHLNYNISEPIVDKIIEAWIKNYPKYPYKKSDFNFILEGFKRKGWCFITTAVCETMKKPDDCYELTAFRNFRDTYMLETEDRRALVNEYYQIAPVIVTAITMDPNAAKRYAYVWEHYLKPCLAAIEENRLAACEQLYSRMVIELKKQYYVING